MSAPQKFMFEKAFDLQAEAIDPLAELRQKFEARVEKARAEAFEEGRKAGEKATRATIENETKVALESLAAQEEKLRKDYREDAHRLEAKAIEFGIAAGTSLAAELIRREPMPLIEEFFRNAFEILEAVPEVTARIHPSIAPQLQETVNTWQMAAGFEGNINFVEDSSLKPADVSIRWQDGGIERSLDDLMAAIRRALTNFLIARDHHFKSTAEPSLMQHDDLMGQPTADMTNPLATASRPVDLIPDDASAMNTADATPPQPTSHDSEVQS